MHLNTKRRILQLARRNCAKDIAWMLNRTVEEVRRVINAERVRQRRIRELVK